MTGRLRVGQALLAVLVFSVAMLAIATQRLTLTYDLSFFLPPPTTDAQQVLIERLGQGPGTQLIFAVLPKASAEASQQIAQILRSQPKIARVLPESTSPSIEMLPKAVWEHRLLLTDLPTTTDAWEQVLEERAMDTMIADDDLLKLIAADPAFASINALEKSTSTTNNPTFESGVTESNPKGREERYLLIQTQDAAFDIDAQTGAVASIRQALAENGAPNARLYGSGVYGVDLQSSIQRESILFSLLASLALAIAVFLRFRNIGTLLLVGAPLLAGGTTGLAVLAILFEEVHGITLAFGFTLLGVAIDYPLHLFSHTLNRSTTGNQTRASYSVWPTLGLGIASTLIAYVAFATSGTQGMQQLGVFAVAGISAAAVCTYFVTKVGLKKTSLTACELEPSAANTTYSLHQALWMCCIAACAVILFQRPLFSNNLSEMTPVPRATLMEDARLRAAMGVADLRYLVSVRSTDSDSTLRFLEQTGRQLDKLVANGSLQSYQSITSLVPSRETQQRRQKAAATLVENNAFANAVAVSEFDSAAFSDFVFELRRTATAAPTNTASELTRVALTPQILKSQSPELTSLVDTLFYESKDKTKVGLIFLSGLQAENIQKIRTSLKDIPTAEFVDLKNASMALVSDYRTRVFKILAAALVAITLLLLATTRSPQRVIWLLGTVGASLGISLCVGALLLGGLSLFDVIALTLVAGLGLDYALFFSRPRLSKSDAKATQSAVTLCALSSLLVFGILACSSVPLLRGLGVTVASGVMAAYILARWGRKSLSQ